LAFEQSVAFQTEENNAIVSDRLNSSKTRYYNIDIIVGKVILKKFDQMFQEEDTEILLLKQMCKTYDQRVCLALLPFYKDKLESITGQISELKQSGASKKEIQQLR
jgi:hypothetical protein